MIEINLLPEGMRKRKGSSLKLDIAMLGKYKFIAAGAAVGIFILLVLIPSLGSSVRKGQIARLVQEEQDIAPQKSEAEAVNKEVNVLRVKMAALDGITNRGFLWAEKLNELSDLVLPGIWFTRVRTDSEERLIIEGSVISKKEEAMAAVGKFMKDIREHDAFFKDFSNIKLETVQRRSIDDRDVVDFRIALYFN
ncbi:unnamed protein product [marine sediment metagenome]|uniref:PilN domain-containing protein n=1 Tax=marine sediment metagenome TaxID=412755 RepID=X0WI00_9ZZZZ